MEEIDSRIRNEMNNLPVAMRGIITGEDLASFESDVGNTSSLEQDIASLEAQLKHKHELCRNTIDEIEALCPDNDNTMNGLGLSGLLCAVRNAKMETGEEPRRISLCCKCDNEEVRPLPFDLGVSMGCVRAASRSLCCLVRAPVRVLWATPKEKVC